jgi:hypothetical protein
MEAMPQSFGDEGISNINSINCVGALQVAVLMPPQFKFVIHARMMYPGLGQFDPLHIEGGSSHTSPPYRSQSDQTWPLVDDEMYVPPSFNAEAKAFTITGSVHVMPVVLNVPRIVMEV